MNRPLLALLVLLLCACSYKTYDYTTEVIEVIEVHEPAAMDAGEPRPTTDATTGTGGEAPMVGDLDAGTPVVDAGEADAGPVCPEGSQDSADCPASDGGPSTFAYCIGGACRTGYYAGQALDACQACPCPDATPSPSDAGVWTCCDTFNGPVVVEGPVVFTCPLGG